MPHPIWVIGVLQDKFISHSREKHIPRSCDKAPEQWDNLEDEYQAVHSVAHLCCVTSQLGPTAPPSSVLHSCAKLNPKEKTASTVSVPHGSQSEVIAYEN